MKNHPEFCHKLGTRGCRHWDGGCEAGYKNPAVTLRGAINQMRKGGEWPCSNSPHREEAIKKFQE